MSLHRYNTRQLYSDYVRAGIGILATLAPIAILRPAWPLTLMLGSIAWLCAYFVLQTYIRHWTLVGIDDEGVFMRHYTMVSFRWTDLSRFSLNYYSLRRDRMNGWMQLILKSGTRTICLDSRLEEFTTVTRRAYTAAKANQLTLDGVTLANLRALRIY